MERSALASRLQGGVLGACTLVALSAGGGLVIVATVGCGGGPATRRTGSPAPAARGCVADARADDPAPTVSTSNGATGAAAAEPAPVDAAAAEPAPVDAAAVVAASTQAPDASAAVAAAPMRVVALGPRAGDGDAVDAWMAERIRRARRGEREWVRVALVFASDGWGCVCPTRYIGDNPNTNSGHANWIRVDAAQGVRFPVPASERVGPGERVSRGMVVRVDGWFTGEIVDEDHRDASGEPEEWLYHLAVLHVAHVDRAIPFERSERFRVALLGPGEIAEQPGAR